MELKWTDGFKIAVNIENDTAVIEANKEGLLSLAGHLTTLAEQEPGCHFHLDKYNSLEDNSAELIICLTDQEVR